ncbi:MAG TPA: adenylate/guanylate cyclase domain-containing protein [Candidatus Limnocylindria bacterium]|nr:adenylate/guanylate cyclase domain-containing protein [Candidatus Limnocylindria bacterium]
MASSPEPVPAAIRASVERRIVTVLFADLVGFTPLSERLDAEDVAAVQDAYFASVRETIERYGGVLEKFIGDAAMAVFGAPHGRDDDAERAVRAGLALIAAVEHLGARLGLAPGELQLRVGVNSGEVVHATDGPDAGRVTGDTVNTAARLQAAARPNAVLVGPLTALTVREAIELTDAGPIELKGKVEPVAAWEADRIRDEPSRDAALGSLRAPLLGREEEVTSLATMSSGRVAVIAPPGVGKSRLVTEVAARLEAAGRRVLRARARPQSATPYEAVGQLLVAAGDGLAPALASLPPRRREVVAREVDALLRPGPATTAEAMERDARFGAWADALDAFDASAAWIIEDVHWAGPDLLAFLDHAAQGDQRLVIVTARPSLLDSAAEWVATGEQLELSTLPRTDASALVTALVGDALPAELVAAIAERSDGNPLFIEELLRTWISVGTLVATDGGWRLAIEPGAVNLPPTVQAIYAAQLDDLPADARLVARRASVAGRRFPQAAMPALELEGLDDGLDVLRRRAFVAGPQPDPSGVVYAYRHALLRDAGYASLARVERARLHAALARWLEETAGARPAEVAQLVAEHYAAAAESVPAIGAPEGLARETLAVAAADWFERAAEAAVSLSAPEAAARLLDRSIELTAADAAIDLARRRMRRGEVLADSAELDAGVADIAAALETFTAALPDAHELYGEAAYRLGLGYMQQIRFGEAEELTAAAIARLADADDPASTARLMALHAWSVAAQGRDEGCGDEAQRAREIGATVDDPGLQVDLLEHFAATTDELGTGTAEMWDELDDRARAAGRWRQAVMASRIRAQLAADSDPAGAMPQLIEATELAEAHGQTEQVGWTELSQAETLLVIGDWDAALEAGQRAITLGERYAYERLTFRTWMVVLPILAERRDPSWLPRYEAWWSGAVSHFPSVLSPYAIVLRAATAQWQARTRGEPFEPTIELPDRAPPFSNPHFLAAREIITEALIATGQLDRAAELAAFEAKEDWTDLMRASQCLIGAWVAQASGADASALAGDALAHARRIGARWWIERAEALA